MEVELLRLELARLGVLYLIIELLIVSLNPIPDSDQKWKAKKHNVIRRFCYYLALNLAVILIATL